MKYDRDVKNETLQFADDTFPVTACFDKRCLRTQPMRHPQMEIKYFTKGSCVIVCDDQSFIAEEGDAIVIAPFQKHYTYSTDFECRYHLLDFDLHFLQGGLIGTTALNYLIPLQEGRLICDGIFHAGDPSHAEIVSLFEALAFSGDARELYVKASLYRLLGSLIENNSFVRIEEESRKTLQRYADALRPAFQYIEKHYSESITLELLARECNFNMKYFCRIFKRYTSQTAMEYVNQFRLHKAEVDLWSSKDSLSEIAERNGFFDLSHFSRYYKKMRGYSPSRIRKQDAGEWPLEND
ncbi:MAG: helix-turn-helix transcriptional regulator [Clostridia bacterium]|nr:helix-turn-helix transcriptional regulator [Clostridia bacterium]